MFEGHIRGDWDFMEPLQAGKLKPGEEVDEYLWRWYVKNQIGCTGWMGGKGEGSHTCGFGMSLGQDDLWRHIHDEEFIHWEEAMELAHPGECQYNSPGVAQGGRSDWKSKGQADAEEAMDIVHRGNSLYNSMIQQGRLDRKSKGRWDDYAREVKKEYFDEEEAVELAHQGDSQYNNVDQYGRSDWKRKGRSDEEEAMELAHQAGRSDWKGKGRSDTYIAEMSMNPPDFIPQVLQLLKKPRLDPVSEELNVLQMEGIENMLSIIELDPEHLSSSVPPAPANTPFSSPFSYPTGGVPILPENMGSIFTDPYVSRLQMEGIQTTLPTIELDPEHMSSIPPAPANVPFSSPFSYPTGGVPIHPEYLESIYADPSARSPSTPFVNGGDLEDPFSSPSSSFETKSSQTTVDAEDGDLY
jgi:hypothetical protein